MYLQPPSFFLNAFPPQDAHKTKSKASSQEGITTTCSHIELEKLRQLNVALRQELENTRKLLPATIGSRVHPLQLPPSHQDGPCLPPTSSRCMPPLTSELLHVEECLQSRVKVLEREKKEASQKILQLEKDLLEQRKKFCKDKEILFEENRDAICKLEHDQKALCSEYQAYRETKEEQVMRLEAKLSEAHEQNCVQVEELSLKLAELERCCSALQLEKDLKISELLERLSLVNRQLELRQEEEEKQLEDSRTQLETLNEKLSTQCQKVNKLEAYLGGEMPDIETKRTWKEEREFICGETEKLCRENRSLSNENKLLNIRLNSLSEILSIQEADMTKRYGEGEVSIRSLLTRWREKVFVLLVQGKVQEIESAKERNEARKKELSLTEEVEKSVRNGQLLSHTLTDKSAQLQLQVTKSQAAELDLESTNDALHELAKQLRCEQDSRVDVSCGVRELAQLYCDFKCTVNQALTRLASYEQRVTLMVGHVQSVTAALRCQHALLISTSTVETLDMECQASDGLSDGQEVGVSYLHREHLEHELQTLCQERDNLVAHLNESTETFQGQLKLLADKGLAEKQVLEQHLVEIELECSSLKKLLEKMQYRLDTSENNELKSSERIHQLEEALKDEQTTAESRMECELTAHRQRSREELAEMEKLLNVARREHSKATVDIQQLTRQLTRDKERAIEAAGMCREGLEQELATCRKKLQAMQVERNLLMTTLREEGIVIPKKSKILNRSGHRDQHHYHKEPSLGVVAGCHGDGLFQSSIAIGSEEQGRCEVFVEDPDRNGHQQEDIRAVLKDLQMLSTTLLSMEASEPDPGIGTVTGSRTGNQ